MQGFTAREAAMDQILDRAAQPDCCTEVTVVCASMFFKDADRVVRTMQRRGTAAALGDGFSRRCNPIHGADLAARCELHPSGGRKLRGSDPPVYPTQVMRVQQRSQVHCLLLSW